MLGPGDLATLQALEFLANQMVIAGKVAAALPKYEEAVDLRLKVQREDHPDAIGSISRLAGICEIAGKQEKALTLRVRLKEIVERLRGPDHPDLAARLIQLADCLRSKGTYDEPAHDLLAQAEAILNRSVGVSDPRYLSYLRNHVSLCESRQEFVRAEALATRVYETVKAQKNADPAELATCLDVLASISRRLGDAGRADTLMGRAKALRGVNQPAFVQAEVYELQAACDRLQAEGKYPEAHEASLALKIRDKTRVSLGEQSLTHVQSYWKLASLCRAMNELGEAEEWIDQALVLGAKVWGEQNLHQALTYMLKAHIHMDLGEHRDAAALSARARGILEKLYGEGTPLASPYLHNEAFCELARGENKAAFPLLQRAMRQTLDEVGATLPLLSEAEAIAYLADPGTTTGLDAYLSALLRFPGDQAALAYERVWRRSRSLTPHAGAPPAICGRDARDCRARLQASLRTRRTRPNDVDDPGPRKEG